MESNTKPATAAQVVRLGAASFQGRSISNASGTNKTADALICPAAVISGATPMTLKRRP
ncbi:hypothetical protein D3C84_1092450 [compost metagenome]